MFRPVAVELKSAPEIDRMRRAGRVVAEILDALEAAVAPGVTTWELDQIAERLIKEKGAKSAFKGYRGFPAVLCASVNHEVVHGIPSKSRKLVEGDLMKLDSVISLEVPIETLVERISGRRSCPRDGSVYHIVQNPPRREGFCDLCGASLVQREDDKPESVRTRMQAYEASTAPLKDFYARRGLLHVVDGVGAPEAIEAAVAAALKPREPSAGA